MLIFYLDDIDWRRLATVNKVDFQDGKSLGKKALTIGGVLVTLERAQAAHGALARILYRMINQIR